MVQQSKTTNNALHAPLHRADSSSPMQLSNVQWGLVLDKPLRAVIYGVEGVGKSTFAAQAPAPIFLSADDNAVHLDIVRFPTPRTFQDVLEALRALLHESHEHQTLVVDSLDGIEPLIWSEVCSTMGVSSIEDINYRKGYDLALPHWRELLKLLDELVSERGMHVILTATASIKRITDPETDSVTDIFRLRLQEKAQELIREWPDALFFAARRMISTQRTGLLRFTPCFAHVLFTQGSASFEARNRFGLPVVLPLSFTELSFALADARKKGAEKVKSQIQALLPIVPDRERAEKALRDWAGDDIGRLQQLLARMKQRIREAAEMPQAVAEFFGMRPSTIRAS